MSNKKPIVVRRVLVIDDAQDVADITVEMLRSMGHVAEAVYDGKAGVGAALRFQPDVVLVDLVMPDVDGFRLVRELRAMFPGKKPKLVAYTAHKQKSFLDAADSAGFDAHITKPVSEETLSAVITE